MNRRAGLIFVALSCLARVVLGQAAACDSAATAPHDTLTIHTLLALPASMEKSAVASAYLEVAELLRRHLPQPLPPIMTNWPSAAYRPGSGMPSLGGLGGRLRVEGMVQFALDSSGHLVPKSLHAETGSVAFDAALLAAAVAADTSGELAAAPSSLRELSRPIAFDIGVTTIDSVPGSLVLDTWQKPMTLIDDAPSLTPGQNPAAPPDFQALGASGSIEVEFLVDAKGAVVAQSIRVTHWDYPAKARIRATSWPEKSLNQSAVASFRNYRFSSALSAGCPVAMASSATVELRFPH